MSMTSTVRVSVNGKVPMGLPSGGFGALTVLSHQTYYQVDTAVIVYVPSSR